MINRLNNRESGALAGLFLFCFFLSACAQPLPKDQETVAEPAPFQSILVLPFIDMAAAHGENASVRSPLSGKGFVTGSVTGGESVYLTAALVRSLREVYAQRTVQVIEGKDLHMEILGTENRGELMLKILESARAQKAEAVMIGFVYDYQERFGRDYGVERPARVGFELNLVHVAGGMLVWQGRFEEQQEPLNVNLLKIKDFFRRKGRWVTAREMADKAIEDQIAALAQKYH